MDALLSCCRGRARALIEQALATYAVCRLTFPIDATQLPTHPFASAHMRHLPQSLLQAMWPPPAEPLFTIATDVPC